MTAVADWAASATTDYYISTSSGSVAASRIFTASGESRANSHRRIFSIPASQEYYWTAAWQEGQRDSLADYARGRTRRFDNSDDALAWLLGD